MVHQKSCDGKNGLEIFVEPQENTANSQRNALVTIKTPGKTKEIQSFVRVRVFNNY